MSLGEMDPVKSLRSLSGRRNTFPGHREAPTTRSYESKGEQPAVMDSVKRFPAVRKTREKR